MRGYVMDSIDEEIKRIIKTKGRITASDMTRLGIVSFSMSADQTGLHIAYITNSGKRGRLFIPAEEIEDYERTLNSLFPSPPSILDEILDEMGFSEKRRIKRSSKEDKFEIIPMKDKNSYLIIGDRIKEDKIEDIKVNIDSNNLIITTGGRDYKIKLPEGNYRIVDKKLNNHVLTIKVERA
jgi:hypothetical protein